MTLSVMDRYKNEFVISFAKAMGENLTRWKKFQSYYRKKLYTSDLKWYALGFILGYTPGKRETDYFSNLPAHTIMAFVIMIFAIIIAISIRNKDYQNDVKSTFFNNLFKVFNNKIKYENKYGDYTYNSILESIENGNNDFGEEILNTQRAETITNFTFNDSELFQKYKVNDRNDDDNFYGEYNQVKFNICETELNNKETSKNGKSYYHQLFHGVALQFKIYKNIKSRVLIYSNGLWNKPPQGYEKVKTEYRKFNKRFSIYAPAGTKGQIEARYLFNTAFLDRFMQLQTSFKVNKIQCSVKDSTILILLSTNKDLFEMNHLLGRIDDKHQYAKLFDEFASVLSFIDVLHLFDKTKL